MDDPLLLLLSFDRARRSKTMSNGILVDKINYETVNCKIWMKSSELKSFLDENRKDGIPLNFDNKKTTKWMDYMTKTKKEMGVN